DGTWTTTNPNTMPVNGDQMEWRAYVPDAPDKDMDGNPDCFQTGISMVTTETLVLDAGLGASLCEGETFSLQGSLDGVGDVEWTGGTGMFDSPNTLTTNYIPAFGEDTVWVYLNALDPVCNIMAMDSVQLIVEPTVMLSIMGDSPIFNGQSTTLFVEGDPNANYQWLADTTLSCLQCDNPTVTPTVTTTYVATTNSPCSDTVSITIVVEEPLNRMLIPNAFSPNEDNLNDFYKLTAIGTIENFSLIIFDRWGQKVFETTDINFGWDGFVDNIEAEVGVYAFYTTYNFVEEPTKSKQGNITLIR
ncbi:MAG: gliding motility-associated C-terminal domain-containing protein, partial [Chitinophagales bacterium]